MDLPTFGVRSVWLYNVFIKLSKQNVKKKEEGKREGQRHKRIVTNLLGPQTMPSSPAPRLHLGG